jgi:hypothetical protein
MKQIGAAHMANMNSPTFAAQIQNDLNVATSIAQRNNMKFDNPLLAVYHYRKHGEDFPAVIRNQKIDIYLTNVPQALIQDGNLMNIETVNDAQGNFIFNRKTYLTPQNQFAVVIEDASNQTISSMYQKPPGTFENHRNQFSLTPKFDFAFKGFTDFLDQAMGFRAFYQLCVIYGNKPEDKFESKFN